MTMTRLFLWVTLPLYLLDQATKAWTVWKFPVPWSYEAFDIPVVEDWFHLVRVHNQGVAFGMGNGTVWAPIVFMFVPLLALALIRYFWKQGAFPNLTSRLAIALLVCGVLGNLTDRLVQGFLLEDLAGASLWQRLSGGYVVDFLLVKVPPYGWIFPKSGGWWPAFNVADSCICIAAGLLFIGGLQAESAKAKAATQGA